MNLWNFRSAAKNHSKQRCRWWFEGSRHFEWSAHWQTKESFFLVMQMTFFSFYFCVLLLDLCLELHLFWLSRITYYHHKHIFINIPIIIIRYMKLRIKLTRCDRNLYIPMNECEKFKLSRREKKWFDTLAFCYSSHSIFWIN